MGHEIRGTPLNPILSSLMIAGIVALLSPAAAFDADARANDAPTDHRHTHQKALLPLEVDHLMIHVAPGAPERIALVRAGFRIAPDLNLHEAQGTASITVEFRNGFLELVWRDTSVSVDPGLERIAMRFRRQGEWRSSGWSPFGIGLRRSPGAPDSLPFPTRAVRAPWMPPGASLDIISSASDSTGPRLFVVPRSMVANGLRDSESERQRLSKRDTFIHANGARVITAVKVSVPDRGLTPAIELVAKHSPVEFVHGSDWLLEITFDSGRRGIARDLRPELPVVCHF